MADWREDLEAERHTVPSPPRHDATIHGPTAGYAEWVKLRSCGDKRGYGHQLDARAAILTIAKNGGPDMAEYRCEYCALWHLTSNVRARDPTTDHRQN